MSGRQLTGQIRGGKSDVNGSYAVGVIGQAIISRFAKLQAFLRAYRLGFFLSRYVESFSNRNEFSKSAANDGKQDDHRNDQEIFSDGPCNDTGCCCCGWCWVANGDICASPIEY